MRNVCEAAANGGRSESARGDTQPRRVRGYAGNSAGEPETVTERFSDALLFVFGGSGGGVCGAGRVFLVRRRGYFQKRAESKKGGARRAGTFPNTPANVARVAEVLAELRGETTEEFCAVVRRNAERLFGLRAKETLCKA